MAYKLLLDGGSGYASFDSVLIVASTDDFSFTFKHEALSNSNFLRLMSGDQNLRSRVLIFGGGTVRLTSSTGSNREWVTGVDITTVSEWKFERISGSLNLYLDGVLQSGGFSSNTDAYGINGLNVNTLSVSEVDSEFYFAEFEINGVVTEFFDANDSGGVGTIIPNTAGSITANLLGSYSWVFYPDAGGGVTGSSAFNLPKLTLSATGSATKPQPIGNGSFNLNLLTVSSSGTATLPQPEISGAFSLQPVTVSSTGSATLPQPTITGAFSFNALTVSSTGTATLPQPNINGSFSYPLLTVDASGSATTANPFINGNITFNKLTVASTGSATLPQPDITGAFSLPKLTVDGTASALVPQPIINGNIALSKLTISASGEVTLPQPIASGAFNIPFITVSGFATISGLQLIIDRETNVNQQFLSANINQKNLSNNFIYH